MDKGRAGFLTVLFWPWIWKMAWRDSRTQRGRLLIFALAVVAGVAALTALQSLTRSVERGVAAEGKGLLGADLSISSTGEIGGEGRRALEGFSVEMARELSFPTMVRFGKERGARLMQMRGIEGGYPFYGEMETEPVNAWQEVLEMGGVVVEAAVLDQFSLEVGDEIGVGERRYVIRGVVRKAAPRSARFRGFSPEVYGRLGDLEGSGLLEGNGMVMHHTYLRMEGGRAVEDVRDELMARFAGEEWRIEVPKDRQESLKDVLQVLGEFLGLIALASLVLGATGVGSAVHGHVRRRIPTIAVLRCVGASWRAALGIYLVQALVLGAVGAVLGAVLGVGMQLGLLAVFREDLPVEAGLQVEWGVALRTAVTGFLVCCAFAVKPLMGIRGVSPAAVLRRQDRWEGGGRWFALGHAILIGVLLVWIQSYYADTGRAVAAVLFLGVAVLVLVSVAKGFMVVVRWCVRPSWPYLLRQGVSNLHRPGNQTLSYLLSLGMGVFLLVTTFLVGDLLNEKLKLREGARSPNMFLIDVQKDQVEGVERLLEGFSLPVLESVPMVSMRVREIGGMAVSEAEGVPEWVARREFRSTYRAEPVDTEVVVAGEFARGVGGDGVVPVSLEEGIAGDMGVGLGDEILLDVQGLEMAVRVTSLRQVDWSGFQLNFFMVFPPGVLEAAPGFTVVTTRTPTAEVSGKFQGELAREFANVSAIDLTTILATAREILERISMVVKVLAGFVLLAGLPILVGILLNGRDVRQREGVLLRTLGATTRQVQWILVIEYAALGLLTGLCGVLLACAGYGLLAIFVFDAAVRPDWIVVGGSVMVVVTVSVVGGLLLGKGSGRKSPLELLRVEV